MVREEKAMWGALADFFCSSREGGFIEDLGREPLRKRKWRIRNPIAQLTN
jgi:hypothetical protein